MAAGPADGPRAWAGESPCPLSPGSLPYPYPMLARPQELAAMFHSWEEQAEREDQRTIVTLARAWHAMQTATPDGPGPAHALELLAAAVARYEDSYRPGPEQQPPLDPRVYQRSLTVTYEELEALGIARVEGDDGLTAYIVPPAGSRAQEIREGLAAGQCVCDLRTRLVGDGCAVCNPGLAAEPGPEAQEAQEEAGEHGDG